MDSHVLSISRYHQAFVPWKRDRLQQHSIQWICVRSSLPLEQRVLHDRSELATPTFDAFVRSVKSRLLQDLKSLPLRNQTPPDAHQAIDRQNVSTYIDEPSNHVLVVYAPNGAQELEFISMTLLPP